MRKPLIIGNWKMNGSLHTNSNFINQLLNQVDTISDIDMVICPPSPYLTQMSELLCPKGVKIGAQNVSAFKAGAYTGEVSTEMLSEVGCSYILLGHSERRSLFLESDTQIAEKFEAVINSNLYPVLCVGETLEQRNRGETQTVVEAQINSVLERVGIQGFSKAVIAYEPVWAIGTGETATPEQAQAVHAQIRYQLSKHDTHIANSLRIIYGGSVNASNALALFAKKDIDGGLIGGASLDAEAFLHVCTASM